MLAVVLWVVDWDELLAQLMSVERSQLLIAGCWLGAAFVLAALRWWILLGVQGALIPLLTVVKLVFAGLFFNLFLPGATGGDIVKAYYVARLAPDGRRARAVLTILIDRLAGMSIFLALVALGTVIYAQTLFASPEVVRVLKVLAYVLCGAALLVSLWAIVFKRGLRAVLARASAQTRWITTLNSLRAGLLEHAHQRARSAAALGVSVLVVLATCAAGQALAMGLALNASFAQIAFAIAFVICATSLPISIAGHGVREGAFILVFMALKVHSTGGSNGGTMESALLFSVIFFGLHLLWGAAGGILFLGLRHSQTLRQVSE